VKRFFARWFDPYVLALLVTLAIGLSVQIAEAGTVLLDGAVRVAVALLFFAYGMRMSPQETIAGLKNFKLQGAVLAVTFALFPLLGLFFFWVSGPLIGEPLAIGVLFLCLLPSTVQSSVVLIASAKGNIPAGIYAATISNVLGIILTPSLVFLLLGFGGGEIAIGGVYAVLLNLLAPFTAGLLLQKWVGRWLQSQKRLTMVLDRGTILLVVFSAAAGASGFLELKWITVMVLIALCASLLAVILSVTWWLGSALGLDKPDRIVLLFSASVKSLATGLPMAAIILPPATAAAVAIPVIIYHQLQLIGGAVIASRLSGGGEAHNTQKVKDS
jgi:sodium/bile acid cotransporter 7